MNRKEFESIIRNELHELGYNIQEDNEPDLLDELYDAIIGNYPDAILTLVKEFDNNVTFYFRKSSGVTGLDRWAIGIPMEMLEKDRFG